MKSPTALLVCLVLPLPIAAATPPELPVPRATLRIETPHPWRPPFHLDRVGSPVTVVVETDQASRSGRLELVETHGGLETGRREVALPVQAPFLARLDVESGTTDVILLADRTVEIARLAVNRPELEAEAVARAEEVINPVDLGAILPPADWILLGPGQPAVVEVAAILRGRDEPDARVEAWFASNGARASTQLSLLNGNRVTGRVDLPHPAASADRDSLHIVLRSGEGAQLWNREIPVMLVREVPERPRFGAYETKLRYDAPISVRDPATGAFSSLPYSEGWDPALKDVVVALPNGARFVFWRGSSYIPFWAGRYNSGA